MIDLSEKYNDHLPPSIKELIDVVGVSATQAIVQERGGISLCVPGEVTQQHWLHNAIGEAAFEKLVATYKNEEIWIARCHKALHLAKIDAIKQAKASGSSTFDLARHYKCSDRYIRMIVASNGDSHLQQDLFG